MKKNWQLVVHQDADAYGKDNDASTLDVTDGFYGRFNPLYVDSGLIWDRAPPLRVQAAARAAFNRARKAGAAYHNDVRSPAQAVGS